MATAKDIFHNEREVQNQTKRQLPCVASDIVYMGSYIGISSGNARPLQAGDEFQGIAEEHVDNSAGSAGDKDVVIKAGHQIKAVVAGSTSSVPGDVVYASDDDDLTMTSTSNSIMGSLVQQVSGTTWYVKVWTPEQCRAYADGIAP